MKVTGEGKGESIEEGIGINKAIEKRHRNKIKQQK